MKQIVVLIILIAGVKGSALAQDDWLQGIRQRFSVVTEDTARVLLLAELSNYYKHKRPDSALVYGYKALILARKIKFPKGEVVAVQYLALAHHSLGNDLKALQLCREAGKIAEKNNMALQKTYLMLIRGTLYLESGEYPKALDLFRKSRVLFDSLHAEFFPGFAEMSISQVYLAMDQPDTALHYAQSAYHKSVPTRENWAMSPILLNLGKIQDRKGNTALARDYFKQSLSTASEAENFFDANFSLAQLYQEMGKHDSAVIYAKKSLSISKEGGFYKDMISANLLLSNLYEKADPRQALEYSKRAMNQKDSLNYLVKKTTLETMTNFDEQERQREIEEAKQESQNRLRTTTLLGSTFTLLVIAFFLYRNSRLKHKAKQKIEKAYDQLKSTQAQLIQSEKMASLGELTAGIAHEIQNPLNFVNNFSEVNSELIAEMKTEIDKGNLKDARAIADNIDENEQKIISHGKRADAIVKGMLQHSRSSSGIKEPTDINALADEYLRLAYHGLRAKDKSFNAMFETHFDESIGNIDVVPQDIGRVILNLITNAFYTVAEKKREKTSGYDPTVTVSTKKVKDKITISVKDNGNGIAQNVLDKIFQPFFTTKPAGQGTGLGLSLSYDIVKAHGGELKVVTGKEGTGAEFIIVLPALTQ